MMQQFKCLVVKYFKLQKVLNNVFSCIDIRLSQFMSNIKMTSKMSLLFKMLSIISIAYLTSCTFKSRSLEVPVPTDDAIEKSFFVNNLTSKDSNGKPKLFLCGWASETETGALAEYAFTHNVNTTDHCNVAFEIKENLLVAKQVNPSFPNDMNRWEIAFTIPINQHYYLEKEKDSAGKDTPNLIKNSSRSHWSARPNMDLNLQGINLDLKWKNYFANWGGAGQFSVENIEWDKAKGFLGFTLSTGYYDSTYNKIRFNILAFDHNDNFKKTPYNFKANTYFNALHIIGEKINGMHQILHAAHWDSSSSHQIRMWGVPDKYKEIVREVVKDWNQVFKEQKIVENDKELFVLDESESKHAFDLRYNTIAWISDEKISSYSALGVGTVLADVLNGEIKWGMITIYGGFIENYIKMFSPTSGSSAANSKISQKLNLFNSKANYNLNMPHSIKQIASSNNSFLNKDMIEQFALNETQSLLNSSRFLNLDAQESLKLKSQIISSKSVMFNSIYNELIKKSQDHLNLYTQNSSNYLENILSLTFLKKNMSHKENQINFIQDLNNDQLEEAKKINKAISKSEYQLTHSGSHFCFDRRMIDVASGWAQARVQMNLTSEYDDKVLRHVIKELITHEYGHFLGLGHQFKENILPQKGTVPDSIYNELVKNATAESGYINYTSVMGYRDPKTEIASFNQPILPGPHDKLVLRYLYRQEYSTFRQGDSDFTFFKIPENGIIPSQNPDNSNYKTAYFPQCNDIDASYSVDPFCNRFDRGVDAKSIVKNYFNSMKDNMIQNLFAFTEARSGNAEGVEANLWWSSLKNLGRVRLFYDYMRLYYKKEIDQIKTKEELLMNFSAVCTGKRKANSELAVLENLFKKNPSLKDLCEANAIALEEMKDLISKKVTDYTKRDPKQRYSSGGVLGGDVEADNNKFAGTWSEMTGVPYKMSTLYAISNPTPWLSDFGLWNSPLYDDANYKYSYGSLYPKEFTQVMSANIKNNMHFTSLDNSERTVMGPSVYSMGWFNYQANYLNNDATIFPESFIKKLRSQHEFSFSMVAIILKTQTKQNDPTLVEGFTGNVYDYNTGKSIPLSSVYMLPGGNVIATASNMFLYPTTRFIPYSDDEGYVLAYKLDYYKDTRDPLSDYSAKTDLKEIHDNLIRTCVNGVNGSNNGLSYFFNSTQSDFKGFVMMPGVGQDESKQRSFYDSIDKAFLQYAKTFKNKVSENQCLETIKGLGLIISTSAVINGFWLPEISDYVQK